MVLTGSSRLPTELLVETFHYVEKNSDLLSLRLACRQHHELLTPRVFHTLKVHPNVRSSKAVEGIAGSRHLIPYVHELVFEEDDGTDGGQPSQPGDKISFGRRIFSHFASFSSLQNLRLHFHNTYQEPDDSEGAEKEFTEGSEHLRLQSAVFEAIAISIHQSASHAHKAGKSKRLSAPSLCLLDIIGLITAPHEIFADNSWQELFSSLRQLSLSTLSPDQELRGGHQHEPYVAFLSETLPCILSASVNLTSLTLHYDQAAHPNWHRSWEDIHFPHLAYLSLKNAVFDTLEDDMSGMLDGMELFIIQHAKTLKALKLDHPWMLSWYDTMTEYPRSWFLVWNNLQVMMQALEEVDVSVRQAPYSRLTEWGYMPENCECIDEYGKANPGGGPGKSLPDGTPRTRYEEQLDNDREALEHLIHEAEMRRSRARK